MKFSFKSIIAFVVCFALIFTTLSQVTFANEDSYVPDITFSGDASQLYTDKYNDILFGDGWEKKYEIEVKDTKTKEVIRTVIPTTNGGTLNKNEFKKSLPKQYKLVKFTEYINKNYIPSKEPDNGSDDEELSACVVETIFDVACLTVSAAEFAANPSFWTGFAVALDGLAVAFPCIPAVGGVTLRAIKSSPKLYKACKYGIKPYSILKNTLSGTGLHAHHIVMKKFAPLFAASEDSLFAIALDYDTHIRTITPKLNSALKGEWWDYSAREVLDIHYNVYMKLYRETNDYLYKYLADLVDNEVIKLNF